MIKQGIRGTFCFIGWMLRGMAWIGIHILKLVLAMLETVLLLTGSVVRIFLLALA